MGTVEGKRADLPGQGIGIYYRDWGGQGTPLVLLHGLSSNSRIWDWTGPILAGNFRVLAVDLRGHGLSDKPEEAYGFEEVSGDVAELVALLGLQRPVIVGHSWGGSVAVQFAAAQTNETRGVVLVDGGFMSPAGRMTWEQAEKAMRPPEIDGMPLEAFVNSARSWPQLRDHWSGDLEGMLLSNFEIRDAKVYRRLPVERHMKIVRAIYEQPLQELMTQVQCPALMIPALREPENDYERTWQEWRREGIALAERLLPHGQVLPMEDTIHDVPVQRPRELAKAIAEFAAPLA